MHVWITILLVRPHVNHSRSHNFILMVLRALALLLEWLRNIVEVGNCWFSKSKELQAGEFQALEPDWVIEMFTITVKCFSNMF